MKTLIALFLFSSVLGLAQTPPANMKLFLLMGQSNMSGRGDIADMSDPNELPHTRVWMLNASNQWVAADNPIHFDIAQPGYGLASRVARLRVDADPTVAIGLIPCAFSGSSLGSWVKGSTHYNNAKNRAQIAQASGTLEGFLWHQGESNSVSGYASYCDVFSEMIGNLRHDLGAAHVPVIAGEIGHFHNPQANINAELNKLPTRVPFCFTVSAASAPGETITSNGDGTHFNTSSLEILGERYAAAHAAVKGWLSYEAEDLTWANSGGSIDVFAPGAANAEASMESWIIFKATAVGHYVEATLPSVPAGTYSVRVRFKRYSSRGQFQLAIDGTNQGSVADQYASQASFFEVTRGLRTFSSTGNHTVRFTVAGKNASSSSYYISIDSIVLKPSP